MNDDHDTVMRWCTIHQSKMDGELCLEALYELCLEMYEDKWVPIGWEACNAVWVEKPTPLGEASE